MKKIFLFLFVFTFVQFTISAQVLNNLVVFSGDGENFTLILNGQKQNSEPDSRVRVTDLPLKVYKVNLIFENKKLKPHQTTLTFFSTDKECIFTLTKHGKKHTMDYVTDSPILRDSSDLATGTTTPFTNTTTPTYSNSTTITTNPTYSNTTTPTYSNPIPTTRTTSTPTYTNTTPNSTGNGDIIIKTKEGNLDLGTNGVKINSHGVNMNVDEKNKTTSNSINIGGNEIDLNKSFKTGGCKNPMAQLDFDESKKTVVSQTTDSTRLIAATKIINANCLLTSQVNALMVLFTTDLSKLHFAKKAYYHTSDIGNFGKLEDTFSSDEGKKDLRNFIKNPN